MGITWMEFDETVGRRDCGLGFAVLVIGIGNIDLGLNGVLSERKAGLKTFIVLDRLLVIPSAMDADASL